MTDKQEYKNQHYIPQCYLKLFSSGGKVVYFKDSHTSPSETRNIACIGCKDDIYSIQTKKVGRQIYLENRFRDEVENPYSVLLTKITKSGKRANINKFPDDDVLTEEDKYLFAAYIVIQYIRMPKFKNYFVQLAEEANSSMLFKCTKFGGKNDSDILLNTYPDVSPSLLHSNFGYGNLDIITKYTQILFEHYWEFLFTESKIVCTSNNPIYLGESTGKNEVDVVSFAKDDVAKFLAISNCYENWVELPYDDLIRFNNYLGFPISRNIYLRVWNRKTHPQRSFVDNRFFRLSDELLTELNNNTLRNSSEIYSLLPFEDIFYNDNNNDNNG